MTFDDHARRHVHELLETVADRLVNDLSIAAREEADRAAAQARGEAEQAAEAALAAARQEAEAQLESAQAVNAALIEAADVAKQELAAATAAAEAELERVRRDAAAELDRVRQEAQGDVDRARQEGDAEIDRLRRELEGELERLHQERAKILLARDDATARLESESRRANELGARLDTIGRDREAVLDRIAGALRTIDHATTPAEILETLLEPLGDDFARAAVFMVAPSSLRGWRAKGLDPTFDITKLVIPRASDSLVARAVSERTRLSAADGSPAIGLSGNPVARAVALPVVAGEHVIAVAYGEDLESKAPATSSRVGSRIAEMLIDHAALRLTTKTAAAATPASAPPAYTPPREVKRVTPRDPVELTVDGAASALVDLSATGAQFLSPHAMRPNRALRLTLQCGDRTLACKAKVMWARFEQPSGDEAAQYRVGVKFTDVDSNALEIFLAQHQSGAAETPRAAATTR